MPCLGALVLILRRKLFRIRSFLCSASNKKQDGNVANYANSRARETRLTHWDIGAVSNTKKKRINRLILIWIILRDYINVKQSGREISVVIGWIYRLRVLLTLIRHVLFERIYIYIFNASRNTDIRTEEFNARRKHPLKSKRVHSSWSQTAENERNQNGIRTIPKYIIIYVYIFTLRRRICMYMY